LLLGADPHSFELFASKKIDLVFKLCAKHAHSLQFPMFPDFNGEKTIKKTCEWFFVLCFFTQATISNQTGDMIAKLISLKSDVHAKSWMGATELPNS